MEESTKRDLDFGLVLGAPFKDKQWFSKCLVMGLLMLVPILGALNLSGWMRAIAERRMAAGPDADTLPDANFDYLGRGWRLFLSWLPLIALMGLVFTVVGGAAAATIVAGGGGKHGGGAPEAIGMFLIIALELGAIGSIFILGIFYPAITFLHVVEGESWSSVQFRRIWQTMRQGGTQYLLFFAAFFVAHMIGQMGAIACYVGMLVTLPLSSAMFGAGLAEFSRVLRPVEPSFPVDGGVGGSSGDPFSVKI
jgi:hypothetical protein